MAMSHDCPFLSTLESFSGNILFMRALLDKECSCCWFRANLLHSTALFTFFEQLCYIQCTGCKGGSPSAPNFSPHVCRKIGWETDTAVKAVWDSRSDFVPVLVAVWKAYPADMAFTWPKLRCFVTGNYCTYANERHSLPHINHCSFSLLLLCNYRGQTGHPFMTSALEGEGGYWKSRQSNWG